MRSGLTSTFDDTVRVQDDLFGYVNNHWVRNNEIPDDRARYGSFDKLREASEANVRTIIEQAAASDAEPGSAERKVGDLFGSFMDTAAIEAAGAQPLQARLQQIAALESNSELSGLIGELSRRGVWGPFVLYVTADAKDPDRYIAYFEQDGLGLPDESYYREEKYEQIRQKYVPHIERMAALAGISDLSDFPRRVMELETRLATHHWDVVATRDAVKTYNKHSLADLKALAPEFDWDAWVSGINAPDGAFDHVVVGEPSFFSGMSSALADHDLDDWKAWLSWKLISDQAAYLSDDFVQESFDFNGKTLSGTPQLKERWKRGVAVVESSLGEVVGQLYVAQHFPPRAKERMVELVDNLIEAYRRDFETLEWMSPATRERALSKLSMFTPKIGYPDKWRDYSDLEIKADDLLGNLARSAEFELMRQLRRIGGPIDRTEWLMTPQTVNAYYHPVMNEIVFPAAILQPPFFDVEADDAVNYGGIGAVIGHEIGHGFDDQGSRFDGDGSLTDWWTPEDRERFDALAQKLIAQFDEESPADAPDIKVNGGLTVGENIGDLGGLTIGYKAYSIAQEANPAPELDGFTGNQRFFLGWSQVWCGKARPDEAKRLIAIDPHAPANCRANVARNLREFHEAFDVAPGDGMYLAPEDQVRIF
ncbi:M13 family metallopeptidase [Yimella sp. cx-51]|uniref:M13 family metallopeptidase n=1 Tax=Yimella sp. cx-51 TaxID=2770551 RepID=UPI00165D8324|nr:M13-type metalloendopeptidase [Yimella sp. cx-51]MBC9956296.1 peptidase M13 [Yimella sp. cx-51]QTH38567.1 peptidase M13 [Yimella sp. cx-51]